MQVPELFCQKSLHHPNELAVFFSMSPDFSDKQMDNQPQNQTVKEDEKPDQKPESEDIVV
jgi:hypothetical protein